MSLKNTTQIKSLIIEQIENVPFSDIIDERYMNYTFHVMEDRAIPDVFDGLKPSQRRTLYGMKILGLSATGKTMKSAKVIGFISGTLHPHGDQVCYPTVVRMVQDWMARYPQVKGQGNWGGIGGDPAAAARYTECKLTRFGEALLDDVTDDVVPFVPNYNEETTEPTVLPSRFPNMICNGSSGIAVGVATNMAPHNLREVAALVRAYIETDGNISIDEMIKIMPGPDFPTGGILRGQDGVKKYYETGRGAVILDGVHQIEIDKRGRQVIVVTGLPYGGSPERMSEQVEELVKDGKIKGVDDMKDLSYGNDDITVVGTTAIRLEIYLNKSANANLITNLLLQHTCLRTSFSVNATVLINGRVVENTPMLRLVSEWINHRKNVICKRFGAELRRIENRLEVLEGLISVSLNIDRAIAIIRASDSLQDAAAQLMASQLVRTQIQADAVLKIQLGALTKLAAHSLEEERGKHEQRKTWLESMLASDKKVLNYVGKETDELAKTFGDDRRTEIAISTSDITTEDLIAEEQIVISLTKDGYIKRVPVATYRIQARGGKGVIGVGKRDNDEASDIFVASTHDFLLFFTNKGRLYRKKGYEIPEAQRTGKGTHLANVLQLEAGETVNTTIPIKTLDADGYLVMVTNGGLIKRSTLRSYQTVLKEKGLKAIKLNEGDELAFVEITDDKRDIFLVTQLGMAIRYSETNIPITGRDTLGVKAMNITPGDKIAQMLSFQGNENPELLVVTQMGYGKRTPAANYRCLQGRYAKGVKTIDQVKSDRNGLVAGACIVTQDDTLFVLTTKGKIIQMSVEGIPSTGRATMGVKMVNVDGGDQVTSITRFVNGMAELDEIEEASA